MSWNAHTDYIFNQLPGQLSCLKLCGPDGAAWGTSGTDVTIDAAGIKTPTSGFKINGQKYMFLRSPDDNFYCYNKSGKGAAVFVGTQYVGVATAGDGYKAEQCVSALEKLKAYLSGIGYN